MKASAYFKILFVICIVCIALAAIYIRSQIKINIARAATQPQRIISPFELQQQLKDKGYYSGNVDGIIGEQTVAAWTRAYNDQIAAKYAIETKFEVKK